MIEFMNDEIYGYLIYISQWLLPILMIFVYDIKTTKLNKIYTTFYIIFMTLFISSLIFFIPQWILLFSTFNTLYLITFYGLISLTFAYYLIEFKEWDLPQASAISIIATCIGTFLWEVPTIVYNLFTRGYEIDIFLQLVVVMFFIFIYTKKGWRTDNKAKLAVILGLIVSMVFLYFRSPIPPTVNRELSLYWNSPYFMTNRFISTMIVIYCVNKIKPMEKSK